MKKKSASISHHIKLKILSAAQTPGLQSTEDLHLFFKSFNSVF